MNRRIIPPTYLLLSMILIVLLHFLAPLAHLLRMPWNLLGMAILLRSLSPFAVVAGFAILMDLLFIRVEESNLQETFGDDWVRYKQRVRKWV
jgi:hypothetical protein